MRLQPAIPLSALHDDPYDDFAGKKRREKKEAELRKQVRRGVRRQMNKSARKLPRAHRALRRQAQDVPLEPLALPDLHLRPPAGEWGPVTKLGEHTRIQARTGHRAAVVRLQPGMYLVAEVPEVSLDVDFGAAPLLAPLLTVAAFRALQQHQSRPTPSRHRRVHPRRHPRRWSRRELRPGVFYEEGPPVPLPEWAHPLYDGAARVARRVPLPSQLEDPLAALPWVDQSDVDAVIAGCGCGNKGDR